MGIHMLNKQKKHRYIKYKVVLYVSYPLPSAPRRPHPSGAALSGPPTKQKLGGSSTFLGKCKMVTTL